MKLVNRAETCCHIRRYIKSVVLDGHCCTIYYDVHIWFLQLACGVLYKIIMY
jgi:hypothetical protein